MVVAKARSSPSVEHSTYVKRSAVTKLAHLRRDTKLQKRDIHRKRGASPEQKLKCPRIGGGTLENMCHGPLQQYRAKDSHVAKALSSAFVEHSKCV